MGGILFLAFGDCGFFGSLQLTGLSPSFSLDIAIGFFFTHIQSLYLTIFRAENICCSTFVHISVAEIMKNYKHTWQAQNCIFAPTRLFLKSVEIGQVEDKKRKWKI